MKDALAKGLTGYYFRPDEWQLHASYALSWAVGMGACLELVHSCFMPSDADGHH